MVQPSYVGEERREEEDGGGGEAACYVSFLGWEEGGERFISLSHSSWIEIFTICVSVL